MLVKLGPSICTLVAKSEIPSPCLNIARLDERLRKDFASQIFARRVFLSKKEV
jgi:hypothetical protein